MSSTSRVEKAKSELKKAVGLLDQILAKVSKGSLDEDASLKIWRAYLSTEYSVALLKLHLKVENPGVLIKKPSKSMNLGDQLVYSSDSITEALKNLSSDRIQEAIHYAREGRDALRSLLLQIRRKGKA